METSLYVVECDHRTARGELLADAAPVDIAEFHDRREAPVDMTDYQETVRSLRDAGVPMDNRPTPVEGPLIEWRSAGGSADPDLIDIGEAEHRQGYTWRLAGCPTCGHGRGQLVTEGALGDVLDRLTAAGNPLPIRGEYSVLPLRVLCDALGRLVR